MIFELLRWTVIILVFLFLVRFVEDHGGRDFYDRHFGGN
jgi:hypothetical protein